MRRFARIGAGVVVAYVAALGVIYVVQRKVMYFPEYTTRVSPSSFPELVGVPEVELKTSDGVKIFAWYSPAPAGRPTVIFFHGNHHTLRSQRGRLLKWKGAGMGVLLLAYRGYAGGEGAPSEDGLYADARAALDWLNAKGVPDGAIVLHGKSLGTGVATKMAVERKVGAVILEAPYTSIADVAVQRFPIFPLHWLITEKFDSLGRIKEIAAPVLVMHGDVDGLIPQEFGRRLFAAANEPKEGFWPHGVGHNDIFDRGGFEKARDFIERRLGVPKALEPHADASDRSRKSLTTSRASRP